MPVLQSTVAAYYQSAILQPLVKIPNVTHFSYQIYRKVLWESGYSADPRPMEVSCAGALYFDGDEYLLETMYDFNEYYEPSTMNIWVYYKLGNMLRVKRFKNVVFGSFMDFVGSYAGSLPAPDGGQTVLQVLPFVIGCPYNGKLRDYLITGNNATLPAT